MVVVAMVIAIAMANVGSAQATGDGLVVDDAKGDAYWVDPTLNAAWADITQFRVETVKDAGGAAIALTVTFETDEAPRDDDAQRAWFGGGWRLRAGGCHGRFFIHNYREGGVHPEGASASVEHSCGDEAATMLTLDADDLDMHTVTGSDDFSTSVTVPFALLGTAAASHYANGALLSGIQANGGPLVNELGLGHDFVGPPQLITQDDGGTCICLVSSYTYVVGT